MPRLGNKSITIWREHQDPVGLKFGQEKLTSLCLKKKKSGIVPSRFFPLDNASLPRGPSGRAPPPTPPHWGARSGEKAPFSKGIKSGTFYPSRRYF